MGKGYDNFLLCFFYEILGEMFLKLGKYFGNGEKWDFWFGSYSEIILVLLTEKNRDVYS